MVKLPKPKTVTGGVRTKTALAVFEHYVEHAEDFRRVHLGASLIGRECSRDIWYSFHWTSQPTFWHTFHPGQMCRLWQRGDREEDWLADDLRAAGVELHTVDEHTGRQFLVEIFPHFGGSIDGAALGFPEAPKTWHLWECKTSNDKGFKKLVLNGVRKAKPEHYAQMQVYMRGTKLKRAMYMCVNKDNDEIYTERVYYDKAFAEGVINKAHLVVDAKAPPEKISDDPAWYQCKFCDHHESCQLGKVEKLERNCRTCASSTAEPDGTWSCDYHDRTLTVDEQKAGCDSHLFIPALMPWKDGEYAYDEYGRSMTYTRSSGRKVVDHGNALTEVG